MLPNQSSFSAAVSFGVTLTSVDNISTNVSGKIVNTGPYKRHSYQVSGSDACSANLRIYATNNPVARTYTGDLGQLSGTHSGYQQIAAYPLAGTGIMYSDEWLFDRAYAAITDYSVGAFTIMEQHSP